MTRYHTHGRARPAAVALIVGSWLLASSPARAELCSAYVDLSADKAGKLASSLCGIGSMTELLGKLEVLDQCSVLQAVDGQLDLQRNEHLRLHAAILVVSTLGRGVGMESADAVTVATAMTDKLVFHSDKRELLAYVNRKLTAEPSNEPLLAFASGPPSTLAEKRVVAAATSPVAAGPWTRPGGQPVPLYIGNQAHRQIANHYKNAHPKDAIWSNDTPISALLKHFQRSGVGPAENARARAKGKLALRPDITNVTTQEIYEIKPAGLEAQAAALLAQYIDVFAGAGVTVKPGSVHAPGTSGVVPAPAGHYRFHAARPGVIVYTYHRGAYVPAAVPTHANQPDSRSEPAVVAERSRQLITARPIELPRDTVDDYFDQMAAATGLSGDALMLYVVISVGSRALPARNAIPIP